MRKRAVELFKAGVAAALPGPALARAMAAHPPPEGPVHLIALGKAAPGMAAEALRHLSEPPKSALAVTHAGSAADLPGIDIRISGHPVPDAAGLASAAEVEGVRVWQHGGSINGFDANLTMFPDAKLAIVVLDNRSGPSVGNTTSIVYRGVLGRELPTPPSPIGEERMPTAEERRAMIGHYRFGPLRIEIAEQADTLVFRQGGGSFGVRMTGTDRARVKVPAMLPPVNLLIVRGADGRADYLHQSLRAVPRVEP